ncbi:TetR/AcrR family transcriptional regulator [Acidicapsa ligni]|uniref:TetR/AcrR family transcriptional regulator n=1 Tax=Acidicapsa ligni TaxID=542300 RepID=UPI0021DF6B89|nr:TetR/AcrR family transcriptional regulator [Acidicapsa ligni]
MKSSKIQKIEKAAPPRVDKKEAILDAMLNLISERGFHDAPMSLVSKRSGASAGVIYHYFPSKEDIIHALYRKIRSAKRHVMLAEYSPNLTPKEAFCSMWIRAYNFYRSHSRETRFLDLYLNSSFCNSSDAIETPDQDNEALNIARRQYEKLFRPRSKGGVLRDLPKVVIEELTFNLAARLAQKEDAIKPEALKKVAEAIWKAIAAD